MNRCARMHRILLHNIIHIIYMVIFFYTTQFAKYPKIVNNVTDDPFWSSHAIISGIIVKRNVSEDNLN